MKAVWTSLAMLAAAACAPAAERPPEDEAGPAATAAEPAERAAPAAPAEAESGPPAPAAAHPDARAAVDTVRAYFEAIAERRFDDAWPLVAPEARPSGATRADFAAAFADYAEYRAEVGAPGRIEGAAGSLWIEVPVRVSGRMTDGEAFDARGVVVLRRCNAVPGCGPAERRWRIEAENIGIE